MGVALVFFGGAALVAVVHRFGGWTVLAAALAVGVFLLMRYYRYLRKREQAGAAVPASVLDLPEPAAAPAAPTAAGSAPDRL